MTKVTKRQYVNHMCVVCGRENALSIQANFYELEDGRSYCRFTARPEHASYPGRMHGGMVAAVMDEVIGRAIHIAHPEQVGVTVQFDLTYRKAAPIGVELQAVGRITKDTPRIFEGEGELLLPDGSVAVSAFGRYVKMPLDQIVEGEMDEPIYLPCDLEQVEV